MSADLGIRMSMSLYLHAAVFSRLAQAVMNEWLKNRRSSRDTRLKDVFTQRENAGRASSGGGGGGNMEEGREKARDKSWERRGGGEVLAGRDVRAWGGGVVERGRKMERAGVVQLEGSDESEGASAEGMPGGIRGTLTLCNTLQHTGTHCNSEGATAVGTAGVGRGLRGSYPLVAGYQVEAARIMKERRERERRDEDKMNARDRERQRETERSGGRDMNPMWSDTEVCVSMCV